MKKISVTSLALFICCSIAACDDVSINVDITCDEGAVKCMDDASYVTCVEGKWDESNPTPCSTSNSCQNSNISTCFVPSNSIDNPLDNNDLDKKCATGSAKCYQDGYVTCGADGYWDLNYIHTCLANIKCTDMESCLRNDTTNECETGSAKCFDGGYVICDKDGHWDLENTLPCRDGNQCTVIENCLNNDMTENGCETGSAKCFDGGYVICDKDGHWDLENTLPCRDGNQCTVIENCLNNDMTENGCEAGSAKCYGDGYVICNEKGKWPDQPTSCKSGSSGCTNIVDCLKPNTLNTPECKKGDIRCIETQYYTCTNEGKWGTTPSNCLNPKGCVDSIADCFKEEITITNPKELQCSSDSKQLQVQVNDQWVTFDDCDSKGMLCMKETDYSICSYKDICSAVDNKYLREQNIIYECKLGQYECYKDDSGCKKFNSAAMCIYDLEERNCNSLKRIKNILPIYQFVIDNQFVLMNKFKEYFNSISQAEHVCYRNNEPSYAFTEGSTICIFDSDKFDIYKCNGSSGWEKTKKTCQRCSQTSTLVEALWNPGDDWLTRDKYTLSATCIDEKSISSVCSDDHKTIQVKGPDSIFSNIADCSSIGRKCDDSTGAPKCI